MSSDTIDDIDRRNVLGRIAAGAAAIAGGTGVASAAETPAVRDGVSDEYVSRYGDVGTVRAMVAERQDLLDVLADEGYIGRASVDALDFDRVSAGRPGDAPEGAATVTETVTRDGTAAAIHVPVESDDGRARVTIVPERDNAFVALPGDEAGDTFRDVETSSVDCNGRECDCCRCRRKCGWLGDCWTVCQCC